MPANVDIIQNKENKIDDYFEIETLYYKCTCS